MSSDSRFMRLLNDRCDIYHLSSEQKSPQKGLPPTPVESYPDAPDVSSVKCHFNIGGSKWAFSQGEPMQNFEALIQLDLPPGTDVKPNDKIVDVATGYEYTAEAPRNLPDNHHIIVMVKRRREQKPR